MQTLTQNEIPFVSGGGSFTDGKTYNDGYTFSWLVSRTLFWGSLRSIFSDPGQQLSGFMIGAAWGFGFAAAEFAAHELDKYYFTPQFANNSTTSNPTSTGGTQPTEYYQ